MVVTDVKIGYGDYGDYGAMPTAGIGLTVVLGLVFGGGYLGYRYYKKNRTLGAAGGIVAGGIAGTIVGPMFLPKTEA